MLTFDDVVNAPVAKLKEAADDWSAHSIGRDFAVVRISGEN
ncbi:hypothetical protein ABZ615_26080 [Streptomyces sp. NPDC007325]